MESTEEQQTPATTPEEVVAEPAVEAEAAPAADAAPAEAEAASADNAAEATETAAAAAAAPAASTEEHGIVNLEPNAAEESGSDQFQRFAEMYAESMRNLNEGDIVTGRVIAITSNEVIVDVGYKSEGLIPRGEFTSRGGELGVEVGDEVDVLLEKTEDVEGHVLLSHQKAQRMKRWNEIETAYKEGSIIYGRIVDRI